jgi:DNA replication ATP-dependent helicase Dna2
MSKNQETARLFYLEILKIHKATPPYSENNGTPPDNLGTSPYPSVQNLYQLLHKIFMAATEQERVPFNTLFARVAYAFQKYEVPPRRQIFIQQFRKQSQKTTNQTNTNDLYLLGLRATADAVKVFFNEEPPVDLVKILPASDYFKFSTTDISSKKAFLRVVALRDDAEKEQLICVEEESGNEIRVQYNIAERNENFRRSIAMLRMVFGFPTTLHLLECEIDTEGSVRPRAFVIEPDYLVDVTAVAECFNRPQAEPLLHLLKKFTPYEVSPSIMKGNIANFFLDELMADPTVGFKETFPKVFKINPLAFCSFEEREMRTIYGEAEGHFIHIKQVVTEGLPKVGIQREDCYLEPSFYAPKYGLQGRLDLFYQNPTTPSKAAIVELKSGKPFRPNIYGISNNHFTQTLLYDMLVEAAFGTTQNPLNYILYSVLDNDNLKYAPVVKAQQYEALNIRNQILALEQALININRDKWNGRQHLELKIKDVIARNEAIKLTSTTTTKLGENAGENVENAVYTEGSPSPISTQKTWLFPRLIERLSGSSSGFEKKDIDLFAKVYEGLTDLERHYFESFASFIAREHQISKMGHSENETANGVAALWLNSGESKEENFAIFSHLKVVDNQSFQPDALILFEKTALTNPLANFRIGDIVVLYPSHDIPNSKISDSTSELTTLQKLTNQIAALTTPTTRPPVLENQIFKCSVVGMTKETVTVRLRSRQLNQAIFEKTAFWNVEHDLLDSSFNAMFRGLFSFMRSPQRKKNLLLTTAAPTHPNAASANDDLYPTTKIEVDENKDMTEEQRHILQKMLNSQDYFLLWGPPGTGKTSVMLKHLVGHLLGKTDEKLLLLAYTNRAVDEICEAIETLGDWVKTEYVRIGSRYSTGEKFHDQLLDKKIETVKTRKDLKGVLESHRVFVATVASMNGKPELLELIDFQRVVIDEASQILEPQLVGLLPHFNHFTLIGDHKQLPAVVQQPEAESAIHEELLHSVGLNNLRNSLFERLYKRCIKENWTWAYDQLSHQGRMHTDIMQFPSINFYEKKLHILPADLGAFQLQNTDFQLIDSTGGLQQLIGERRVLFLNSETDTGNNFNKTNAPEARLIGDLVDAFEKIYAKNDRKIGPLSIGVITPYRAQIAQIQAELQSRNFDVSKISIDTVERYQGGARDVILLSLCTNEKSQLSSLVSLSEEGVDRKLNVALTRARRQLVVIGNAEILNESEIYRRFIEAYRVDFKR